MHSTKPFQSGFTMVELAIVIIVVGVLLGIILQGVELVNMSRVKATASQVKNIQSAVEGFWDKYNALPGDLPNPGNFLPNCGAPPCNQPGDNVAVAISATVGRVGLNNTPANDPTGREGEAFFAQLRAGDFYTNVNPALGAVWGGFYPETPIPNNGITAGSFMVAGTEAASFGPTIVDSTNLPLGLYLVVQGGTPAAGTANISGQYVAPIDRALDDGTPDRGIMRGKTGGTRVCSTALGNQQYRRDDSLCGFFIFIGDYTRDLPTP